MNPTDENEGGLSKRLRSWKVDASLPPGTADQVWHRIALSETPSPTGFGSLLSSIQDVFSRPAVAGAYVAILLIMGVLAGGVFGSAKSERRDRSLASRYLASVDPYTRLAEAGAERR